MNEWCIDQHGRSGLTEACLSSPYTHDEVEEKVRAYIEKWIPEQGAGLLAGSTVHADMRWVLSSREEGAVTALTGLPSSCKVPVDPHAECHEAVILQNIRYVLTMTTLGEPRHMGA
jgi:hypothetical protein